MWLIERLKTELGFIKQLAPIQQERFSIMTDQEYQDGMTAAIVAFQATTSYPVTGFSYTYTPAPTATPPAETVTVNF